MYYSVISAGDDRYQDCYNAIELPKVSIPRIPKVYGCEGECIFIPKTMIKQCI